MGNKVMELMDSPLMSAIPRLRPLQPMGRPPMQLLMDSLPLVRAALRDFGSRQLGRSLRSLFLYSRVCILVQAWVPGDSLFLGGVFFVCFPYILLRDL